VWPHDVYPEVKQICCNTLHEYFCHFKGTKAFTLTHLSVNNSAHRHKLTWLTHTIASSYIGLQTWHTHRNTYAWFGLGSKYNCKKQEMSEIVVTTWSKINPNLGLFSRGRSSRGENKYSCISTDTYHDTGKHWGWKCAIVRKMQLYHMLVHKCKYH
jgi:hypothetical protein